MIASFQVGKQLAAEEELKEQKGVTPGLAMMLVGDRQDSQSYVGRPSKLEILQIPLFGTLCCLLTLSVGVRITYFIQWKLSLFCPIKKEGGCTVLPSPDLS